ncbi:MAG: cell wall hydrolase [Lachnospiraceae bacterium]|nr:cell wall hydrolase [Lachnospiraceae bacterium]
MSKNFTVRITALTCAFLLSLISIGASPFGKKATADKKAPVVEVPEVEQESFILDQGAAGITEKDIFVEITKTVDTTEPEVEEVPVEEEEDVNFVMANVQNSVNVRAEANTDCEVVGMLYNKCGGTILEKGDGWTKIESGELVGWVRNDFLYFGEEAREYAEQVCDKIARVNVECLRIRKGPSTEAETDGLFEINSEWTVLDELEDWVEVDYKGAVRYVSADYVDVEFFIENGETMEEIKAREAIAALEKAKLTANQGAYSASVDETTLLGAIIQAEAGNQCYDGKLAVGAVVLNRVKSAKYPNSIAEVIYAPGQFGPASNGSLDVILTNGVNEECMQAAREALEGATTVGDAKNFHRAGSGESGIVIGAHVFY